MANIVALADVRRWLRFPNPDQPSSEDTILQWLINSADVVIEAECDEIVPKRFSEYYDGGDTSIHLRHIPLLSVENIEEGWGYLNYELDYVEVNSPAAVFSMFAYSIESYENGEISRRTAGNVLRPFRPGDGNIYIQYTAGEATVPGNIFTAELKLIRHWYQNEQLRAVAMAGTNVGYDAVSGQAYTRDTETGDQNINIGVPYAILEEIKAHRRRPIIA